MGAEEQRESYLKRIKLENQLFALEALFTADEVTLLQNDFQYMLLFAELARVGIVQRNNEIKPQFIHRTFADYFVAECLIKQLTKTNKQHEKVLNKILLRTNCEAVRAFLDGLFEKYSTIETGLERFW